MLIVIAMAMVGYGFVCFFGRNLLWEVAWPRIARRSALTRNEWDLWVLLIGLCSMLLGVFLLVR